MSSNRGILVAELSSRQGDDVIVYIAIVCIHLVTVDGASPVRRLRRLRGLLPPANARRSSSEISTPSRLRRAICTFPLARFGTRIVPQRPSSSGSSLSSRRSSLPATSWGRHRYAEPHRSLPCRRRAQRSAGGFGVCGVFGGRHRSWDGQRPRAIAGLLFEASCPRWSTRSPYLGVPAP